MISLNRTSKKGRGSLYFKKIFTVIPKVFILSLISYSALIIQNIYLYPIDNLTADIKNLQCLQSADISVSILGYIILNFIFEFLLASTISLIVAALSAFCSRLGVIIISACLFVLPSALDMVNINFAGDFRLLYLLNLNSLILADGLYSKTFFIHFIIAVICIIMLYLCKRKWCLTPSR
ncbi:MAG: hypothetical protein LUG95_07560 [Clostridiales bacterium]|nr:hypothetical protein [Clostridiales bacterium]